MQRGWERVVVRYSLIALVSPGRLPQREATMENVGLLFVDFEGQHRMRLNGVASIDQEDQLMAAYPEAQFVVWVRAREAFPNCPRYIHHYQKVDPSAFVPREGCETPVPDWKEAVAKHAPELLSARDRELVDRRAEIDSD